jgi:DNA-directed RNA polymerase specialized sigma24 family protein
MTETEQASGNRRPSCAATQLPTGKGRCEVVIGSDADSRLRADVALLASVLAGRRDELAEVMTQRIIGTAGMYHTLPTREKILKDYGAHLDAVMHAQTLPADQQAQAVRAVSAAHGRVSADEGMPLAILMEFYRLGMRVLWEAVLQACGEKGMPGERLADAVWSVWRLQDVWVHSMTDAYYKASREMIRSRERERSALVGAVLDGRVQDPGELRDIAEALRLPHDSRCVVVAAEVPSTGQQDKIRVVENRLSRAGIPSAWRLLPDGQAVVAGIAAVGGAAGLQVLADVLSAGWEHRAGISPQFDTLDSARRALRFAKLAMASTPRGSREVTVFDQAPVAVVAASAPDVLAELAQAVLGSLNQLPDDERQLLIGTLRTWLACGGSTDATAKALYCHPNTVRYRLNRVTEHTGRSLTDPQAVTELSLALQADFLAQSVQPPAYARRS